jgi:protein-S-isoprenylcysteine O-methyltransferase Ste14
MNTWQFGVVIALWAAWLAYWTAAAAGQGKPVLRRESDLSRSLQSYPMILGGLLMAIPDLQLPVFDERVPGLPMVWRTGLGIAAVVVGLLFTVWARRHLADNWSVSVIVRTGHELVLRGPYAWVRHPIYTGALLALMGTAITGGQWRGLVGALLVAASLLYKIRLEERFLSEHFGDEYRRYCSTVPALVPLVY